MKTFVIFATLAVLASQLLLTRKWILIIWLQQVIDGCSAQRRQRKITWARPIWELGIDDTIQSLHELKDFVRAATKIDQPRKADLLSALNWAEDVIRGLRSPEFGIGRNESLDRIRMAITNVQNAQDAFDECTSLDQATKASFMRTLDNAVTVLRALHAVVSILW